MGRFAQVALAAACTVLLGQPLTGEGKRVPWTASRLAGSPDPPLPYTVERVFDGLRWDRPLYLAAEPPGEEDDGPGHLLVVLQGGEPGRPSRVLRVPCRPGAAGVEAATFFELPGRLIYGLAFDPGYASNRWFYIFSNGPTGKPGRHNRVSRYTVSREAPPRVDPASELAVITWASEGHDGGDLAFGPDGMLYITTGDGTSDSDGWVSGQTLDDLLGAVLRIDVRGATEEKPYAVPEDNPFVESPPGARPEIWAYGLRNPWRMDIDHASGQVWVGNNGQDLWETAHLVRRGENYGWSVFEGSHPFFPNRQLGPTPHVPPTLEHPHSEARSLTGGVVYRGEKWPGLDGAYIYGDYSTGRIWGALHDGERLLWHRELADTTLQIAAFRAVPGGDLLVVDHGGGIYRVAKAPERPGAAEFPRKLSETGLFASLSLRLPEDGVYPYGVNAPAWHDGAGVERWIAVPGDETIKFSAGPWAFPDGTALVQTLSARAVSAPIPGVPESESEEPLRLPVETRVLLRQQGEWTGYSYRWDSVTGDADLVAAEGLTIKDGRGGTIWRFPSRAECATCHSRAANYVLGVTGRQLNRDLPPRGGDGDGAANQLRELERLGLFSGKLPEKLPEPAVDPYDAGAGGLEARARSYLQVNCAHCHVEAGGGNAPIDLRAGTPRERMKLFGARPQHATFGIDDAMLVAPGDPGRSVLLHRVSHRGPNSGQMPPLGTLSVDEAGAALIREWIGALKPDRAKVRAWKMDDFGDRDFENFGGGRRFIAGREAYSATGCVQCHRIAGEGGSVGPDLAGVGSRLSPRAILESILEPSKSIAANAGPHHVVPGTDPPLSTMPAGMVDVLERDALLDLVYYLHRDGRPAVAALVTEYRHNSHADVIVSRLLQTDTLDGKGKESPLRLVSLYTDQVPETDTSRALAAEHGFSIFPTITGALTLGAGGGELAVDGVLLVAEHGDYPKSETGNTRYPKRRFWEETLAVFEAAGRGVPVFVDKHLADNWTDADFIYRSARERGVPLMAGSSLPTTWRRPPADLPRGAELEEIVAITFHTTDAYGFHALEFVQALAEQRKGGETGIAAVRATAGDAVWRAFDDGSAFDPALFDAAWDRLTHKPDRGQLRRRVREPRLLTLEYADGPRAHLLELNGAATEWSAAWRYQKGGRDSVDASLFWTQEGRPAMHFTWLLNGVEQMILTGKPSWRPERTLLTSGALDALLISLKKGGNRLETPYLQAVNYQPAWRWKGPPPPPPMRPWSAP